MMGWAAAWSRERRRKVENMSGGNKREGRGGRNQLMRHFNLGTALSLSRTREAPSYEFMYSQPPNVEACRREFAVTARRLSILFLSPASFRTLASILRAYSLQIIPLQRIKTFCG